MTYAQISGIIRAFSKIASSAGRTMTECKYTDMPEPQRVMKIAHDRIKAAGKWPEGQTTMGPDETLAILKAMYPQHVAKDVDA